VAKPIRLSHVAHDGKARMVSVSEKEKTHRLAEATGMVMLGEAAFALVVKNKSKKGDILAVAKIAGIMAAKNTAGLVPLCHPIELTKIDIWFQLDRGKKAVHIFSAVEAFAKTGVEMEAITAVSIAAVTVYDMAKSVDKGITISNIQLLKKSGGKSGDYIRRTKPRN